MAEKTPAKILHESLVFIFDEAKASLKVDQRPVTVFSHLPENAFSQKAMPMVVVERPKKTEEAPWGRDYERRVYAAPVLLVDAVGVRPGDEHGAAERIDLLFEKVKAVLAQASNANLRLPWLHVFWSLASWDEDESTPAGNNLIIKPLQLSVPMTLERGKVWNVV
jgi:hypothetical protein